MLLERLTEANKPIFLDLELYLAVADGHLGKEEKELIDAHCIEMEIDNNNYVTKHTYDETIAAVVNEFSDLEKKIAYIELISIALVDEVYTIEEQQYVEKVRQLLQIKDEDAEIAMDIMSNLIKYGKELDEYAR